MKKASDSSHIVVTGALGFIGTNIVRKLNKRNINNLILVDHLTNVKKQNLKDVRYDTYLDKKEFIKKVKTNSLPKICAVIHMGACSDTREYDKKYLKENNLDYSKKLFQFCVKNDVQFIYASSGSVYGDGEKGYSEKTTGLKPLNPYGLYKYEFDKWVLSQKKKPLQWVGLRFFNVYGPYEDHKGSMASVVYHGFHQIKKNGEINLFKSYKKEFADGMQLRDFVYVKDVVRIIEFFLKYSKKSGIFNVGTGKAESFLQLATSIFNSLQKKSNISFIDMPDVLRAKYQYFTQADINHLRKIGYKNRFVSLRSGVRDYVINYLLPQKI